ncbi:hypothetical protein ABZ801_13790 [Actinomadura sp. NPDC047616]|uniref:hypothetical protein n=1 Tax=Actinomadura sp. NPDC047616 TaxID=3155914 RepID=UPI003405B021
MSVRRVGRLLALGVLVLLALSACGGDGERALPGAWVDIAVMPDGGAQVDLRAAGRLRSDAEVRDLAGAVAREVFPGATGVQVRTVTSRGYPFARADVTGAYRPGRTVPLELDTARAWRRLAARGFDEGGVRLWLPSVPATVRPRPPGGTADVPEWTVGRGRPAPVVRVVMRPRPALWFGAAALLVLVVAGVVVSAAARRWYVAVSAAAVAIVCAVVTVSAAAGRQGDNLGVAGVLGGRALAVAAGAPLAGLPLGLVAVVLFVRALRRLLDDPAAAGSPYAARRPGRGGARTPGR